MGNPAQWLAHAGFVEHERPTEDKEEATEGIPLDFRRPAAARIPAGVIVSVTGANGDGRLPPSVMQCHRAPS